MEEKLIQIINEDRWMVETLKKVRSLDLPDSWIGAGFVRNKIWDCFHNKPERTPLNDIDVIYFNVKSIAETADLEIEKELKSMDSKLNWSVKNQARMHKKHNHQPYQNCLESISFWVETPTCIAIQIDSNNELKIIAPHGIQDLMELVIRPIPGISLELFNSRITEKKWLEIWPMLKVLI